MTPYLAAFLDEVRTQTDAELGRLLAEGPGVEDDPGRLREAMRYAVLGGGKRLRPAVVVGAARALGGPDRAAMGAAVGVELLHAYTLVHDDLPAMDNDDLRRGRPTVHRAFGEASAILVGDALLTAAFGALASLTEAAEAVRILAARAGARALLAGQSRDLAGRPGSLEELERLHADKTGALFAAAAELGGLAVGASPQARAHLSAYGMALGVAFQHADDLADADHPELAQDARRRLGELVADARRALAPFAGQGRPLLELADWVAGWG